MTRCAGRRFGILLCLGLVAGQALATRPLHAAINIRQPPNAAINQDALTRAKDLYASARFEEALQLLEALQGPAATPEARAYQVYCLVALGRRDEAKRVIERIVRADPFFRPQEGLVAPRIRAFFDDTRKPLLPVLARESYASAKTAYDRHDMPKAIAGFDRVIALLDDIGGTDPGLGDLRAVSVVLRDLARAASPAAATPAHATGVSGGVEPSWTIYDAQSANVVAPTPLSTPLPDWRPGFFELNRTFSGEVRLIIGEDGTVLSAEIATSVHARYDDRLLEAARRWTFKPATRNGSPVTYRYLMPVRVLR